MFDLIFSFDLFLINVLNIIYKIKAFTCPIRKQLVKDVITIFACIFNSMMVL